MKKSELADKLLAEIPLQAPVPHPVEGFDLLQQGLYAVLLRALPPARAEAAVRALIAAYPDWNELRVSQVQEIAGHVAGKSGTGKKRDEAEQVARLVKEYLQEVFQNAHGLDLEFLREDAPAAARFASQLPFMGMATGNFLLWLADERRMPVTPALVRVLDRLGLVSRSGSVKKARAAIEPLVPKDRELEFAMRYGAVASIWCDPRKPVCWECVLVQHCVHGKKVHKDWRDQQARLEQQRAREAARQAVLEKKEAERRRREEERARKRSEAEAARRARELERRRRAEEKKRKAEEQKRERERAREEARRAREDEKKRRAEERVKREEDRRKKAAAAKKAAAKKKAAGKKAAKKKPSTSKAASAERKKTTKKKPAPSKKPTAPRGGSKAKKPTTQRRAGEKKKKTTRRMRK